MNTKELEITEVKVFPLANALTNLKANVKVVLNDCFVLRGLKVIKGQFGHFMALPNLSPGSPNKLYDISSVNFRKKLQNMVLQEYAKALSAAVPA